MPSKLVKLSSKNQLTIPTDILKRLPPSRYFEIRARGQEVVLRPAQVTVAGDTLKRVRAKIRALGLTEDVIPQAINAARKNHP